MHGKFHRSGIDFDSEFWYNNVHAGVAEWQTHRTQNAAVYPCRFKSGHRHHGRLKTHVFRRFFIAFPAVIDRSLLPATCGTRTWQALAQRLPSCQKATALAAATFRESTPWDIGMRTV